MMGPRNDTWMPMYWGDYLKDTGRLTTELHGAYMLLIADYWTSGKPLPDDDEQLAAIARMPLAGWRKARRVLEPFFQVADGLWRHKRIEEEIEKANSVSKERSKSGAKGAAKRWQRDGTAIAEPLANALQNDAQSQSQSQSKKELPPTTEHISEGARLIVIGFLECRERFWPSDSRLPSPRSTLEVQAQKLAEQGLSADFCCEIFERVMTTNRDRGEGPPTDLGFCRRTIEAEIGKLARARATPLTTPGAVAEHAMPPQSMTDEDRWRRSLARHAAGKPWLRNVDGPAPGEPGCRVPAHLLLEKAS